MLWNRSYNLTPGWSLGFFSWTEHNILFQEKEIWVHSSNKDYRLGSNLAHTSVRADVYCSRNQVMLVYPGCPLHWQKPPHTPLSVGGAGFRLKGSWDLDQRQHAPEQCWQGNSTYFYPTFSLAITTEMLLLQNAAFPRPALLHLLLFKRNCCKGLIDRICEYSFLLIYKPLILWALLAYSSLETDNTYFLEARGSPDMVHGPFSLSDPASILSLISIVDCISWTW